MAKTDASSASSGVQALKTDIEKGDLQSALQMLTQINDSIGKAQANIAQIPDMVKFNELYDKLNETSDAITAVAKGKGLVVSTQDVSTVTGPETKGLGGLNERLDEVKSRLLFIQKLADEKANEPVIQEDWRGVAE